MIVGNTPLWSELMEIVGIMDVDDIRALKLILEDRATECFHEEAAVSTFYTNILNAVSNCKDFTANQIHAIKPWESISKTARKRFIKAYFNIWKFFDDQGVTPGTQLILGIVTASPRLKYIESPSLNSILPILETFEIDFNTAFPGYNGNSEWMETLNKAQSTFFPPTDDE